jgi:hypothetical protein
MEQEFKRTFPSKGIHESSTMDENSTNLTKHSKNISMAKQLEIIRNLNSFNSHNPNLWEEHQSFV